MIHIGGNEIDTVFFNGQSIVRIYCNGKVVFELSRSCFGSGYWNKELTWNNEETWINE